MTQVGSGTYVSDKEIDMAENERQEKIEQSVVRFLREMEALGVKRSEIPKLIEAFKEES